jgi:hypothetical protein
MTRLSGLCVTACKMSCRNACTGSGSAASVGSALFGPCFGQSVVGALFGALDVAGILIFVWESLGFWTTCGIVAPTGFATAVVDDGAALLAKSALPLRLRRRRFFMTGGGGGATKWAPISIFGAAIDDAMDEAAAAAAAATATPVLPAALVLAKSALPLRLRRRFWTTGGANKCAMLMNGWNERISIQSIGFRITYSAESLF